MNTKSNGSHFQHILRLDDRGNMYEVASICPPNFSFSLTSKGTSVELTTSEDGGNAKKRNLSPQAASDLGRALLLAARINKAYETQSLAASDRIAAECRESETFDESGYLNKMRDWQDHQSREVFLTCVRDAERDEKP